MEKLAFLFTGQGSQYVGMAESLYKEHEIVRQTFEEASDILKMDIANLCFKGGLTELTKTENTQPALVTVGVSYFRTYMKEVGIAPHFLAGHSLGEYTALACAGALSFSDTLKTVRNRGLLTRDIVDTDIGAMTIVDGANVEFVEEEARKISNNNQFVKVNCYNAPQQVSIAGHKEMVESLESRLLDMDHQISPLLLSAPFHTELMHIVEESLKKDVEQYTLYNFLYPVISNVNGKIYSDKSNIPHLLAKQATSPVKWIETMNLLKRYGVTHAIEMGPKNVLSNLVKLNCGEDIEALCYASKGDRSRLQEMFPESHHLKRHIPTVVTKSLAAAVATPNKNDDKEAYQKGVVEPYRKIAKMQEMLDQENAQPSLEQMKEALDMLNSVFETKKILVEERREWFHHILHATGTSYILENHLAAKEEVVI